jgi:hypothetical protein
MEKVGLFLKISIFNSMNFNKNLSAGSLFFIPTEGQTADIRRLLVFLFRIHYANTLKALTKCL